MWVKMYVVTDMFLNPSLPLLSLMQLSIKWKWYSGICKAEMLFKLLFLRENNDTRSEDIQEKLCRPISPSHLRENLCLPETKLPSRPNRKASGFESVFQHFFFLLHVF